MNVTSYLPVDPGVIQAHGTHFRTVNGEQTEVYGVGAPRWDVVKLPKEEECKLCMGRAEGEGAWKKRPKTRAGKPPEGVGRNGRPPWEGLCLVFL